MSTLESTHSVVPLALEPFLDADDVVRLGTVSRSLRGTVPLELAYRRLCLRDYLSLVLSGPGFESQGDVSEHRWQQLYHGLSSLSDMQWVKDDGTLRDGASGARRRLRSDRNDYTLTHCGKGVVRSGGSYFFNISIAPIDSFDFEAAEPEPTLSAFGSNAKAAASTGAAVDEAVGVDELMASMQVAAVDRAAEGTGGPPVPTSAPIPAPPTSASDSICVSAGVWTKVRVDPSPPSTGCAPPPKYFHSLTALADRRRLVVIAGQHSGGLSADVESATNTVHVMNMAQPLAPLELWPGAEGSGGGGGLRATKPAKLRRPEGWWIKPTTNGSAPPPRRGHTATLLPHDTIAVVGGSLGAAPIKDMEVYLLEVQEEAVVRWARVAVDGLERSLPGRVFHSTFIIGGGGGNGGAFNVRVASGGGRKASVGDDRVSLDVYETVYDLFVFGGQQLGLTNGYLDSWVGKLTIWRSDEPSPPLVPSPPPLPPSTASPPPPRASGDSAGDGNVGANDNSMNAPMLLDSRIVSCTVEWQPDVHATDPPGLRRGHTTYVVGRKLLCFGGAVPPPVEAANKHDQGEQSAHMSPTAPPSARTMGPGPQHLAPSTVCVLGRGQGWSEMHPWGEPPASRRGHGLKLYGGSLLVSGGFDSQGARLDDREGYRLKFLGARERMRLGHSGA